MFYHKQDHVQESSPLQVEDNDFPLKNNAKFDVINVVSESAK